MDDEKVTVKPTWGLAWGLCRYSGDNHRHYVCCRVRFLRSPTGPLFRRGLANTLTRGGFALEYTTHEKQYRSNGLYDRADLYRYDGCSCSG